MKDILVALKSYPEPTPAASVKGAVAAARHFGAVISGAMCQVGIPQVSNFLADRLVGASEAINEENRKSRANAESVIETLREEAGADLAGPPLALECGPVIDPIPLAEHARLFDLTIVPSYGHGDTQNVAETLVFASGRPVLLVPVSHAQRSFDNVLVGWDGSLGAARAVHDALPFLKRAGSVHLVSVTGDKIIPDKAPLEGIAAHLARHGIQAATHLVPREGRDAGSALLRLGEENGADLLVMGAYGRSKVREFILGGATATIIANPTIPVLLAQ